MSENMKPTKTIVYYEILHGEGLICDRNGICRFDTLEDATKEAVSFKNDPKSHNERMSDENVKYWMGEKFVIQRVTKVIDQIHSI